MGIALVIAFIQRLHIVTTNNYEEIYTLYRPLLHTLSILRLYQSLLGSSV
jgi:hypothetical protein